MATNGNVPKLKRMLALLDRLLLPLTLTALALLIIVYLLIWSIEPSIVLLAAGRDLALSVVSNLIPVLIGFAIGFLVFRGFDRIRVEQENEDFTDSVAEKTSSALSQHLVEIKSRVELGNQLVADSLEKGIEKVCTNAEIAVVGSEGLQRTTKLRVIGLGNSWLLKEPKNHQRLLQLLEARAEVIVLLPDPLSLQVRERYMIDEPSTRRLDLPELALRVLKWYQLKTAYPRMILRVVHRYPMVNVTIYDHYLFASPLLYQRRGIDNLTVMFRYPSPGAEMYEDHFNKICDSGSDNVDESYVARLREFFHL